MNVKRIAWLACLVLVCAACGGGIGSYKEGMEAQFDIMEEMIGVLEGVTDDASAKAAVPKVEALGQRLADLAGQIQKLPEPSMEELQEMAEIGKRRQSFQSNAGRQMMKLAQYPELTQAFSRAMASMQ